MTGSAARCSLSIILSLSVPFLGCGQKTSAKLPPAVRVITLGKSEVTRQSRYSANILPATRVDLAFKIGGYVEFIAEVKTPDGKTRLLEEGDPVTQGMVLVRVRAGEVTEKLGEARAAGSGAAAQADIARQEFERARSLFEKGAISKSQFDGARAQYRASQANVEAAAAGAKQVRSAVSDTTLKSPIDGVVLKRMIEVGSLVGPGVPGFIVADTSSVRASFGLPDTLLGTLQLGSPIQVSVEALPGVTFSGVVSRVAPAADMATRVFEVETSIPNPRGVLKTGMVASVRLGDGGSKSELLVPLSALVRSTNKPEGFAVFLAGERSGKQYVTLTDVELGEIHGNAVPAISGLKPDDTVVVMGAGLLSDGEEVRIIPGEGELHAAQN
ncbi:MAG: efflux RND transporter periplasmic adaptor subunit [Myxococcota bacterium]